MTNAPCARSAMTNRPSSRTRREDEAYLLHRRPYRDSSLIVDLLTRRHGRIGLVCRAARQPRSTGYAINQCFCPLQVGWQGRGDLASLRHVEALQQPSILRGDELFSGLYVNELLMRLLHRHDPCPDIFDLYVAMLAELPQVSADRLALHSALRRFEICLLTLVGYGPVLLHDVESGQDVEADADYLYRPLQGPVLLQSPAVTSRRGLVVHGRTLLGLAAGQLLDELSARQARQLMRQIILACLGGKPLQSWRLFSSPGRSAALAGSRG